MACNAGWQLQVQQFEPEEELVAGISPEEKRETKTMIQTKTFQQNILTGF